MNWKACTHVSAPVWSAPTR